MKNLFLLIVFFSTLNIWSQTDYYTKKGVAIKGYDVTEYFNNTAVEGSKEYSATYDGVVFYFATQANKEKFKANPKQFIPQYGGYCAYAVGAKGEKVSINPKTFEIRDGKLYLFYNSFGTNTLDLWNEENPEALKAKADENWIKIQDK